MNYSKFKFTLDTHKHQSQVAVPVMVGDTAVQLYITLTDGGFPYRIEDGCWAVLYGMKPDGKPIKNNCIIENNTIIRYDFTAQTTSVAGTIPCEVRLYGPNGLLTSPCFSLVVDARISHNESDLVSDTESTALDRVFMSEGERVANEQERLAAEALRIEAEEARIEGEKARVEAEEARKEDWEALTKETDIVHLDKGEGRCSIVQKNGGVTGSNGVSVVADAKANGRSAIAVNARTEANGDCSFSQGYNSKAYTKADAVFNSAVSGLTEAEFKEAYPDGYLLSGEYLDYNAFKKRVCNNGFAVNGGRAIATNSFSCGGHSAGKGSYAPNSATFGEQCKTVAAPYTAEGGTTGNAKNSICGGSVSYGYSPNSIVYGFHLTAPYHEADGQPLAKAVFGHYNSYARDRLMQVGNGTGDGNRKDAFAVMWDGRAKVQSAPIESDDVVRLGDLPDLDVATKNYVDKELAPAKAFLDRANIDTGDKTVIDTLKEIQDYIKSDETGASAMAASIQQNTESITDIVDGGVLVGYARNSGYAFEAGKAITDGNGNNIADTYATKADVAEFYSPAEVLTLSFRNFAYDESTGEYVHTDDFYVGGVLLGVRFVAATNKEGVSCRFTGGEVSLSAGGGDILTVHTKISAEFRTKTPIASGEEVKIKLKVQRFNFRAASL